MRPERARIGRRWPRCRRRCCRGSPAAGLGAPRSTPRADRRRRARRAPTSGCTSTRTCIARVSSRRWSRSSRGWRELARRRRLRRRSPPRTLPTSRRATRRCASSGERLPALAGGATRPIARRWPALAALEWARADVYDLADEPMHDAGRASRLSAGALRRAAAPADRRASLRRGRWPGRRRCGTGWRRDSGSAGPGAPARSPHRAHAARLAPGGSPSITARSSRRNARRSRWWPPAPTSASSASSSLRRTREERRRRRAGVRLAVDLDRRRPADAASDAAAPAPLAPAPEMPYNRHTTVAFGNIALGRVDGRAASGAAQAPARGVVAALLTALFVVALAMRSPPARAGDLFSSKPGRSLGDALHDRAAGRRCSPPPAP